MMALKTYEQAGNLLTKKIGHWSRGEQGKGSRGSVAGRGNTRNELTQMKFQWKIYERIKFANQIAEAQSANLSVTGSQSSNNNSNNNSSKKNNSNNNRRTLSFE